jgi:Arc/MetJ family transcription regulator
MGRTNIDTDDQLLDVVMRRYGVLTKTAAVDLALRRLAGEPSTIDEALELRGARLIGSIPDDPTP